VRTVDAESGEAVGLAPIYCVGREITYEGRTDENGSTEIAIHESELQHVIAAPRVGYWSKAVSPPPLQEKTEIEIRLQKHAAGAGYGWGHRILGADRLAGRFTGQGIKIALIDSGASEHASVRPAGGFNALPGEEGDWKTDDDGHGTHCAGIIAAQGDQYSGLAPAAELYPVKIHPGGRLSDFVEAVNWCIDNYMDIVNIGVGGDFLSQQMELVLLEAYDRGITCIAPAGNDCGPVAYPAAFEHVLAVSAMGKTGEFPEDAAHAWGLGEPTGYEGLFFAGFSNAGPEIDLCAPGVAVLSTVPGGEGARDGTSTASAFVAGVAALVLEGYPEIRSGDAYQPCYLRRILFESAVDLGLPIELQGAGLVSAEAALAEALLRREQDEADREAYRRELKAELEQAKRRVEDLEQALADLGDEE